MKGQLMNNNQDTEGSACHLIQGTILALAWGTEESNENHQSKKVVPGMRIPKYEARKLTPQVRM
jgi:hypothetical protein